MDIVIDVTTDLGGKLVFELPNNTQMAQFLASMQKASYQSKKCGTVTYVYITVYYLC